MEQTKEFKLIVAGGREFNQRALLEQEVRGLAYGDLAEFEVSLVSGMARGADRLAFDFAKNIGIRCYEFKADWDQFGKRAGYLRNDQMRAFADGLLAFHDGKSRGTQHMIDMAKKHNMPVKVVNY